MTVQAVNQNGQAKASVPLPALHLSVSEDSTYHLLAVIIWFEEGYMTLSRRCLVASILS